MTHPFKMSNQADDAYVDTPVLSIVVPVFNEAGNLRALHSALSKHLIEVGLTTEIILVDDGSSDGSDVVARQLSAQDQRVRLVKLSRNFGHQIAITAGMAHASGSAVIVMDADLQHPPALIPELVSKWRDGYDVVYTVHSYKKREGYIKRTTSVAFYKLLNRLAEVPIVRDASDYRLMDRAVVDHLVAMPERARFLRGMVSWLGFRQIGIHFEVPPRYSGKTKYSLKKMFSLAVCGLTSFSVRPLQWSGYMGFFTGLLATAWLMWFVVARPDEVVMSLGIVTLLYVGALQFMALGIIGQYLGSVHKEVRRRPSFVVSEMCGFDDAAVTLPAHSRATRAQRTALVA